MAAPQLPDLDAFALQVTIHVKPEDVDTFLKEMKPVFEKVAAEPECLYFEIFQDPANPGSLSWVENWNKSPAWMMTEQLSKEYYKPYFAATEPLFVKPREFKILRRLSGFVSGKKANFEGAWVGDFRE